MHYYKLKFENEEQATKELKVLNTLEEWEYELKILGKLYKPTEDEEVDIELEGYHVDIVSRVPLDFKQFEIKPNTALHAFA